MNRPHRPLVFLGMAREISKRSTCMRLAVGAIVIVKHNVIAGEGYVGHAPGEAHCRGNDCPGRFGCNLTIHAEINALARIPNEYRELEKDMYCTHSPCGQCAGVFPMNKIKRVFFEIPYRDPKPVARLIDQGIEVYRVTAAGYTINCEDEGLVEFT